MMCFLFLFMFGWRWFCWCWWFGSYCNCCFCCCCFSCCFCSYFCFCYCFCSCCCFCCCFCGRRRCCCCCFLLFGKLGSFRCGLPGSTLLLCQDGPQAPDLLKSPGLLPLLLQWVLSSFVSRILQNCLTACPQRPLSHGVHLISFQTCFVQAFRIVVNSWKFTML